jgi:6,7-dimethyl-8-ribityllumazine synthase
MATQYKNLSEYDLTGIPEKKVLAKQKYAIAVADWNSQITHTLLKGAVDTLLAFGIEEKKIKAVHVPGAFELIYAAKELCDSDNYDAVITLGCVIQGDTPHFDYVCQGVTSGISRLNTINPFFGDYPPVIFGVLTVNTLQQAEERAGGIHGNKGVEAAITAIKMATIAG